MRAIVIAIAGALVAVTVGTAQATPGQCQRTIIKEARTYAQQTLAKRQSCIESASSAVGFFDCHEDDPELGFRIDGLKARLSSHVLAACRNETLASVGWDLGAARTSRAARATTRSPPSLTSSSASPASTSKRTRRCSPSTTTRSTTRRTARRSGRVSARSAIRAPTSSRTRSRRWCDATCAVLSGDLTGPCSSDPKTQQTIDALELRTTSMLCARCGGADHQCGGGDDHDPGDIGFVSTCPDVTTPNGQACGWTIGSLSDLVAVSPA